MNEKAKPIKINAQITAWTHSDCSMERFMQGVQRGDRGYAINALAFSLHDMSSCGYVKVGMATVEVEVLPAEELQSQQLAMLTAQLEKERAESQVKQNAILDRISKLQAIGYSSDEVF